VSTSNAVTRARSAADTVDDSAFCRSMATFRYGGAYVFSRAVITSPVRPSTVASRYVIES